MQYILNTECFVGQSCKRNNSHLTVNTLSRKKEHPFHLKRGQALLPRRVLTTKLRQIVLFWYCLRNTFLSNSCRVQEDNSKHYEMRSLLRGKDNFGSGYNQWSLSASCYKTTQNFSLQSSQYLIACSLKAILQNILLNQVVERGGDHHLSNSAGLAVPSLLPQEAVLMRSSSVNKQWTTAAH